MAFLSSRDGAQQVQLLALDGGEARQLTHSASQWKAIQGWSHEARLLLTVQAPWAEDDDDDPATSGKRSWVVNFLPYKLDGSGPQVGQRTQLVEVDVATGEERVLVSGDFDVKAGQWSPDGQRLAFVRTRSGQQRHRQELWLADADGGNATQVVEDIASISGIQWSPDGATIAFGGSNLEGDSMVHLWLLEVASGEIRCPFDEDLQLEGSTIVWHPDGKRVATIAAHRGLQEVSIIDLDGEQVERVDSGLRHASALCASGDGLAFVSADMCSLDEIHLVGWDGTDEARLTDFNQEWFGARPLPRNLIRCSKAPVQMVVFPGGDHHLAGTGKPRHRELYHRRLADWVDRHG